MFLFSATGLTVYTVNYSSCPSLDFLLADSPLLELQYWQSTPVAPLLHVFLSSVTFYISVRCFPFSEQHVVDDSCVLICYSPCILLKELSSLFPILYLFTWLFLFKCRPLHLSLLNSIFSLFSDHVFNLQRSSGIVILASWILSVPLSLLLSRIWWV